MNIKTYTLVYYTFITRILTHLSVGRSNIRHQINRSMRSSIKSQKKDISASKDNTKEVFVYNLATSRYNFATSRNSFVMHSSPDRMVKGHLRQQGQHQGGLFPK